MYFSQIAKSLDEEKMILDSFGEIICIIWLYIQFIVLLSLCTKDEIAESTCYNLNQNVIIIITTTHAHTNQPMLFHTSENGYDNYSSMK